MTETSRAPHIPTGYRVLHVSDSHLSSAPEHAETNAGWTEVVRYTERSRPDVVIHTGDVIRDDPDSEDDYVFGAMQLRRLTMPWFLVPGNHDIGDTEPDPYHGLVSAERLARYKKHFDQDRWSTTLGRWLLIGLNSQLFDNVLTEEEKEQWGWFDQLIADNPDKRLALFFHKPPCLSSLSESMFSNKTIGPGARARLLRLAEGGQLKLIGVGHLHEYITFETHGVTVVAAPSTGMITKDPSRALGVRCNGVVEYFFHDDGFRFQMRYQDELGDGRLWDTRPEVHS